MSELAEEVKARTIPGRLELCDPARLRPNPWNPNRMDMRTFRAAKASIEEFGFIDPVTVRPHPDEPDVFQILDGEHRAEIARDLSLTLIPILVLDGLPDALARKLTIVLNDTRGHADRAKLADLIAELHGSLGENATRGMPYSSEEVKQLLDLAATDTDAHRERLIQGSRGGTLSLTFDEDFRKVWKAAVARAKDEIALPDDDRTAATAILLRAIDSA